VTSNEDPVMTDFLSPNEAAKKYGVSEKSIRSKVAEGKIPAYSIGRLIRIDPQDLRTYYGR